MERALETVERVEAAAGLAAGRARLAGLAARGAGLGRIRIRKSEDTWLASKL